MIAANSCVTTCHQIYLPVIIRNQQVVGSNPTGGSRKSSKINDVSETSTGIESLAGVDCPQSVRICEEPCDRIGLF